MSLAFKTSWNLKHAGLCLAMSFAVFALVWTVRHEGVLEPLELRAYDALLRSETRDYSFSSRFLIVCVDDADIAKYGYPIPDEILQRLIEKLQSARPRAIGVDIVRDFPVPPSQVRYGGELRKGWNEELRNFLAQDMNSNVNWVMLPIISNTAVAAPMNEEQCGFAEISQDPADECIRRALLVATHIDPVTHVEGKPYPSIAYQVAMTYLAGEPTPINPKSAPGDLVQLGPSVIQRFHANDGAYQNADDAGYQFLLDYRGPRDFPHSSISDVLEKSIPETAIRDNIIMIGVTTYTNKDLVRTPINNRMFGVVYQALATEQFLRFALHGAHPISSWSDNGEALYSLGWAVLGGLVGYRVRSLWRWTLTCAAGIAAIILIAHIEINRGVWIPLLPPMILWAGCAALVTSYMSNRESSERKRITKRFSNYVDPSLVNYVINHPDHARFNGEAREMTMGFTDLAGFTTLTESLGPRTVPLLSEYMNHMIPAIRAQQGYVSRLMGDGIYFFFGAPEPDENHAVHAVTTVLTMHDRLAQMNLTLPQRNYPLLQMRAGVCTGPVIVGDAGSREFSDYTAVGDSVNTAARLESANKFLGTKALVSARTIALLNGRFLTRPIGCLRVAGKTKGITVYEPLAEMSAATAQQRLLSDISMQIVSTFQCGNFQDCVKAADELEKAFGAGKFSSLYRMRSMQYQEMLPDDFDGQIVFAEK